MISCSDRIQGFILVCASILVLGSVFEPAGASVAAPSATLSDSLYYARHPRLLFTDAEAAALYYKVRDGGDDDAAYSFIRDAAVSVYPGYSMEELLDDDYALNPINNLGLAGYLEVPRDAAALALGRQITLHIADHYGIDTDAFGSSLRLRSLALGYDMFFANSPESERDYVRNEIISYIDYMTGNFNYEVWGYRPYLGNKTMMIAASLGLAAICLDGETDPARVSAALDHADGLIDAWLAHQLDERGAYNEGLVYGSWSMRMLVYYFHARKRYDGFDYADNPQIRRVENWIAYELLPEGAGRTNNLNDCAGEDYILSRHHTYLDWAQSEWGSQLSAWLWDHIAGSYGWDWELEADKAATVIWNQSLPPVQPGSVLPKSVLWEDRGLYYFRTGWNMGPYSDDVIFSFYAGAFQGAHAQEDQGQFTLYGFGAKFAIDHGPGPSAKQSEAHNLMLVDDLGQHNAGSSIGTDGEIREYLLSDYADYMFGDVTDAYTTHSPWNDPDVPFEGADWSWGYDGGNPVDHAFRKFIVVHDKYLPPYFILLDEIEKDDSPHDYEWRMHTHDANSVDVSTNPMQIANGSSILSLYVFEPSFASLQKSVTPFSNDSGDPDAMVLSLSVTDTSPRYDLLMLPADETVHKPSVDKVIHPWGYAVTLDWGMGIDDVFVCNTAGDTVTLYAGRWVTTDASLAIFRVWRGRLLRYLVAGATTFVYDNIDYVTVTDGPLNCALTSDEIQVDRYEAKFKFYAPGIDVVYFREQQVPVILQGDYVTRDPNVAVGERPPAGSALQASASPNPFNPTTAVRLVLARDAEVQAVIYDVTGKPVRTLWRGMLPAGTSTLPWDGSDNRGNRVASGVYFLTIHSRGESKILKLVMLK